MISYDLDQRISVLSQKNEPRKNIASWGPLLSEDLNSSSPRVRAGSTRPVFLPVYYRVLFDARMTILFFARTSNSCSFGRSTPLSAKPSLSVHLIFPVNHSGLGLIFNLGELVGIKIHSISLIVTILILEMTVRFLLQKNKTRITVCYVQFFSWS